MSNHESGVLILSEPRGGKSEWGAWSAHNFYIFLMHILYKMDNMDVTKHITQYFTRDFPSFTTISHNIYGVNE